MSSPSFAGRKRAVPGRQLRHQHVVERLEERCLLSGGFAQINLASDIPGLARVTDPNLVNPWGLAYSPTGPFWFANNGSGVSNLLDGRGQPIPLVVTVPAAARSRGKPTGTVFNGGDGFPISQNGVAAPSRFLFAGADGTISGWTAVVDPARALQAIDNSSSGAAYTGLALAADPAGHRFLYAADFHRGTIAVFDRDFRPVARPDAFRDPNLPDDFVPFNIQNINNLLFVTYAQHDEEEPDEVDGDGQGFIDVYDSGGSLIRRFASQGALNAPWGLAIAPLNFGPFGGALLVGNNGDGHINALDASSGIFLGQLTDEDGLPIAIPDLWALTFGNGHLAGDSDTLFFTAGADDEEHGLFGAIQSPLRRGADTAGPGTFDPHALGEPGDYPVPPIRGPALQQRNDPPRVATAILLPSRESSLAMIPTLSTVSQPGARGAVHLAETPTVAASFQTSVGASPWVASTHFPFSADDFPFRRDIQPDSLPLSAFLDLNATYALPRNSTGGQWAAAHRDAIAARHLISADDAAAERSVPEPALMKNAVGSLSDFLRRGPSCVAYDSRPLFSAKPVELHGENLETRSSAEQGPDSRPSGQTDMLPALLTSDGRLEPADNSIDGNESVEIRDRSQWMGLVNSLLVAVSVVALCASGRRSQSTVRSGALHINPKRQRGTAESNPPALANR
jgi:uncharacterized protein (TIGR03118 family)